MTTRQFHADETTPPVLVAALKAWLPELSWSKVRKLLQSRHVTVGGSLCMDEARRLKPGDVVSISEQSMVSPPQSDAVKVHYVDKDIVVVDKPPRMLTVRHKRERAWPRSKKQNQPTLEEVLPDLIYSEERRQRPPLLAVHRIDRDTSGLLVWARHEAAQQALIEQFSKHDVVRRYKAIVAGQPQNCTVRCHLIRNRGDGLRGSTTRPGEGKESVTHIEPRRSFHCRDGRVFTEVRCELETGRTHQIRIHLAEMGHPVCGDSMYRSKYGTEPLQDDSLARRLALHAYELGFTHPISGAAIHFDSDWPKDMQAFIRKLEDSRN